MSFQLKGWDYTESVTNLRDPDDLPLRYAQRDDDRADLSADAPKKILMLGLGGGSISTYLGRSMPDVTIDTVETRPRRDQRGQEIFRPPRDRARALSRRRRPRLSQPQQEPYDLILVDAFRGGYVPFHLLTKEFYRWSSSG